MDGLLYKADLHERERLRACLAAHPLHRAQQHGLLTAQSEQLPAGIGAAAHAQQKVMRLALR